MRLTIYVPDALDAEIKAAGGINVSAVCQAALQDEITRRQAVAGLGPDNFGRVQLYDSGREHDVAFQGREIGRADWHEHAAYLTPGGSIVVEEGDRQAVYIYDDYAGFAAEEWPAELAKSVAEALGEKYVEDLDI
jgi:hypothetical protein